MSTRWSFPIGAPSTQGVVEAHIDGRELVVLDPRGRPAERRCALAEAFAAPHRVPLDDARVRFEVFAAIAARLTPGDLTSPRDRARLAFWRAYDPQRARPQTFVYVRGDGGATVLRLDALGLHVPEDRWSGTTHHLPDEVFVHGPPRPAAPRQLREAMRRALFASLREGHGLRVEDCFPRVDHPRIGARRWAWGQRADGESWLTAGAGVVVAGYDHGHDGGSDAYAPERVMTDDPRVTLGAPPAVEAELRAHLAAATLDPHDAALAATDGGALSDAERALRLRVIDRAPWPRTVALEFDGFLSLRREADWSDHTALGLYGSLRPEVALPATSRPVDRRRYGHAYNWGDDELWIAPDGSGVLSARECFGGMPGDGVDEVLHVSPDDDRRVIFDVGTDYTQNALTVFVSARDDATLAALRAHVEAYFRALGLPPPKEVHDRTAPRRQDAQTA